MQGRAQGGERSGDDEVARSSVDRSGHVSLADAITWGETPNAQRATHSENCRCQRRRRRMRVPTPMSMWTHFDHAKPGKTNHGELIRFHLHAKHPYFLSANSPVNRITNPSIALPGPFKPRTATPSRHRSHALHLRFGGEKTRCRKAIGEWFLSARIGATHSINCLVTAHLLGHLQVQTWA